MGAAPDSAERNESSICNSPGRDRGSRGAELVLTNLLTALVVDGVTVCRLIAFHWLESVGIETMMVGSGQTIQLMRERGLRSKIIGLTSGESEKDRVEMIQAGANDCLEEPLSANGLADILADIDCC